MCRRGFGFVHHSRTVFCRAVPNPNITIRNFFIAVRQVRKELAYALAWSRAAHCVAVLFAHTATPLQLHAWSPAAPPVFEQSAGEEAAAASGACHTAEAPLLNCEEPVLL